MHIISPAIQAAKTHRGLALASTVSEPRLLATRAPLAPRLLLGPRKASLPPPARVLVCAAGATLTAAMSVTRSLSGA